MEREALSTQIERVTGQSGNAPGQGPFMIVRLALQSGVVVEATYETYQCPACHACGKALTAMVTGKKRDEARAVNWDMLSGRVGPLPRNQRPCLSLALLALDDALKRLRTD
jgi:NifU-like protein involved in Fe-S cluster formation